MTARHPGSTGRPSPRTVQVALPLPPRCTFTYLAPEAGPPLLGSRVRVPFGGRYLIGYVVPGEAAVPPEKLKPVAETLDATPFFPPAVLDLTRWIADYYLVSWGSVLKCAYPSGLDPSPRSTYRLAPEAGKGWPERLAPALDALRGGPRKLSALRAALGPQAESMLQEAVKEGWAVEETHWVSARRHVGADRVALLLPVEEAEAKAADPDLPKALRKALSVLLRYQERGFPTVSQIASAAKVPQFTLAEMAEAGWVELFDLLPAKLPGRVSPHVLTDDQRRAVAAVSAALGAKRHETFLLFGVTGSGKTEVYLRLMERALESGGTCLYLVPEISLASFLARRLIERFGSEVAILHSAMTEHERVRQWLRVARGGARLVIGPRSALFAPLADLALIIVDEEHDASFKQQDFPRYHARDMAVLLGVQSSAPVVLGSATPSVESFYNAAETDKYTLLTLPERTAGATLPPVQVVDMRAEYQAVGQKTTLSRALRASIADTLSAGRQVVILRNRLGFSTFVLCRGCGHTVQCTDCSVALTYHRRAQRLKCHYCGHQETVPAACPSCGGEFLQFLGEGTEKVEDALSAEFPEARVARMDRDAVRTARDFDRLWRDFEGGGIDILAGTQMVAKGHDIPNVTLSGILSADFLLGLPDFRAAERTFQLITQAAGRAGRGGAPGIVILQSFHPDHYAVRASAEHDFVAFYEFDIRYRKMVGYPPVGALARVEFRHADRAKVAAWGREAGEFLNRIASGRGRIKILGPIEPPIARLEGQHRLHLLLKAPSRQPLREALSRLLDGPLGKLAGRHMLVEIDPYSLL